MITQVFPDEFHLNTLDQLLGAIAQLNPHVNIKAIVIGLMDRLSAYAARESESEPSEDRRKIEEDATASLLEKLRISKETKKTDPKPDGPEGQQPNGEQVNGERPSEASQDAPPEPAEDTEAPNATAIDEKPTSRKRGIPEDVKLYEIFYDQVTHLVTAQRLHIQDTIALLVSLSNLAL